MTHLKEYHGMRMQKISSNIIIHSHCFGGLPVCNIYSSFVWIDNNPWLVSLLSVIYLFYVSVQICSTEILSFVITSGVLPRFKPLDFTASHVAGCIKMHLKITSYYYHLLLVCFDFTQLFLSTYCGDILNSLTFFF